MQESQPVDQLRDAIVAISRRLGIATPHPLGGGNPQAMHGRGLQWAGPVFALCMFRPPD